MPPKPDTTGTKRCRLSPRSTRGLIRWLTRFTCGSGYAPSSWVTSTPSTRQARRISRSEHTVTITSRARVGSDRASSFVAMTLQVPADIGSADAALLLLQSATLARARGFDDRRQDHEPATLETDTDALGSVPHRFPTARTVRSQSLSPAYVTTPVRTDMVDMVRRRHLGRLVYWTDAFGQREPFPVPISDVGLRPRSRDLEWFCRKEHQSGNAD